MNTKKRKIWFACLVAILTLVVGVGATYAWLIDLSKNIMQGVQMEAVPLMFELAVPERTDSITKYDDLLEGLDFNATELTTEKGSIKWVMTDRTQAEDIQGIHPGSNGVLQFYVVPQSTGTLNIHFDISLTPYTAEFETGSSSDESDYDKMIENSFQLVENDAITGYLEGHLLFFEERDEGYFSKRIDPEKGFDFSMNFTDMDPKLITIHWIWPNTFGQMVLFEGQRDLHGDPLFSEEQSAYEVDGKSMTPIEEIKNYISTHGNRFFKNHELEQLTSNELAEMLTVEAFNTGDNIIILSDGYNQADREIGNNISFVLVELTATSD